MEWLRINSENSAYSIFYMNKSLKFWLPSLLSGVLIVLSSAPYDIWYLAYVAYVPLFLAYRNETPVRQGLAYALCCSLVASNWWHSTIIYSALFFILIVSSIIFLLLKFLIKPLKPKGSKSEDIPPAFYSLQKKHRLILQLI